MDAMSDHEERASAETSVTVQCPCGAVRIELAGAPLVQFYCHCDDCQIVHGAAYVPAAMYPASSVRVVAGETASWKLKTTERVTCRACGCRLFAAPAGFGIRGVVATLLPAGMFRPTFHVQCQYALVPVKDDLPHYRGFPARFGGSDEMMPW